jgi:4-hydroxy-tetrahydrodipicolinate reductase
MTRIAVHGAGGRMGRGVIACVCADQNAQLVGAIETAGHPLLGKDAAVAAGASEPIGVAIVSDAAVALDRAEVVIDFSTPVAVRALVEVCAARKLGAVVGTTGLDADTGAAIEELAAVAPVVCAPNFSVGVNALWALSAQAVRLLGGEFDLEVVEMHHKHKADAPSGTALELLRVVADARGLDPEWAAVPGRSGDTGARQAGEIGVHSLRGGDVVGDHTLVLAGPGERLELTHRAHTREVFARGALRAAHWTVGRAPGLYGMSDVLGLAG